MCFDTLYISLFCGPVLRFKFTAPAEKTVLLCFQYCLLHKCVENVHQSVGLARDVIQFDLPLWEVLRSCIMEPQNSNMQHKYLSTVE